MNSEFTINRMLRALLIPLAVMGAMLVGTVLAQAQTLILAKHKALGGDRGPLGKALGKEIPTQGKKGGYQLFQNGTISWSPHAGHSCILAAYWNPDKKNPNSIIVHWGPTDPFHYDMFIVRWEAPGVKAKQSDVMTKNSKLATRKSGSVLLNNTDRKRAWTVMVEGANRKSGPLGVGTSTRAPQGWMHAVKLTPPRVSAGPMVGQDWQLQLERLRVHKRQESSGDEPYFIVIGFRSKFATPKSTQAWGAQVMEIGSNMKTGVERNIQPAMGQLIYRGVTRVKSSDIMKGKMPEILGAVVVGMESDGTPFSIIRGARDRLRNAIADEVRVLIEQGKLRITSQKDASDDIRNAVSRAKNRIKTSLPKKILDFVRSGFDPDDMIGVKTFLFVAAEPTPLLKFPADPDVIAGPLEPKRFQIGSNPIVFSGDGAVYHVTVSVRRIR